MLLPRREEREVLLVELPPQRPLVRVKLQDLVVRHAAGLLFTQPHGLILLLARERREH